MSFKGKKLIKLHSFRFALGCIFAASSFAISLLVYNNLKAAVLFSILFLLAGSINIPEDLFSEIFLPPIYVFWVILTAFVTLVMSQLCLNETFPESGLSAVLLGMLLILSLFLISIVITLKVRISVIVVSAVLIVFTCINHFVYLFRGSEIAPADILSITTAGNVAAEYSFFIPAPMYYAFSLSVICYFFSYALPAVSFCKKGRMRIVCGIASVTCFAAAWIGGLSVQPLHWLQTGSAQNGYLYNFTLLLRESFPNRPRGYTAAYVDSAAHRISTGENHNNASPDILVIMDESFADFSFLGKKVVTDGEITPFINQLRENTLYGYTLSSVFGGGTPNSEYEFLSGNSFLFLPTGSIAYQQFIKDQSYTIAQDLKNRGYSTVAMHPYQSNSWMRDRIWPMLGFDDCRFIEDFPRKSLLRNWGTDREMFETITSVYEAKRETSESPVFMFAVTIQNHGGYDYVGDDFSPTVHLQGYSRQYPDAEQYLTCIHETDKAVEWLINYYKKADRDVVILFYGDHYPRLNEAFFEEVHGGPFETLDERMLQYEVPFFIWTNYESETEEIELTSMNYLAGLLYQRAGMELPPYNQFLEQLRQTIPACNAFGYYSRSAGRFLPLDEAQGEEKQALLEYNYLEWNSMFDKENRNVIFFPYS